MNSANDSGIDVLGELNREFEHSKAQQIQNFLVDQTELNKRFDEYELNDKTNDTDSDGSETESVFNLTLDSYRVRPKSGIGFRPDSARVLSARHPKSYSERQRHLTRDRSNERGIRRQNSHGRDNRYSTNETDLHVRNKVPTNSPNEKRRFASQSDVSTTDQNENAPEKKLLVRRTVRPRTAVGSHHIDKPSNEDANVISTQVKVVHRHIVKSKSDLDSSSVQKLRQSAPDAFTNVRVSTGLHERNRAMGSSANNLTGSQNSLFPAPVKQEKRVASYAQLSSMGSQEFGAQISTTPKKRSPASGEFDQLFNRTNDLPHANSPKTQIVVKRRDYHRRSSVSSMASNDSDSSVVSMPSIYGDGSNTSSSIRSSRPNSRDLSGSMTTRQSPQTSSERLSSEAIGGRSPYRQTDSSSPITKAQEMPKKAGTRRAELSKSLAARAKELSQAAAQKREQSLVDNNESSNPLEHKKNKLIQSLANRHEEVALLEAQRQNSAEERSNEMSRSDMALNRYEVRNAQVDQRRDRAYINVKSGEQIRVKRRLSKVSSQNDLSTKPRTRQSLFGKAVSLNKIDKVASIETLPIEDIETDAGISALEKELEIRRSRNELLKSKLGSKEHLYCNRDRKYGISDDHQSLVSDRINKVSSREHLNRTEQRLSKVSSSEHINTSEQRLGADRYNRLGSREHLNTGEQSFCHERYSREHLDTHEHGHGSDRHRSTSERERQLERAYGGSRRNAEISNRASLGSNDQQNKVSVKVKKERDRSLSNDRNTNRQSRLHGPMSQSTESQSRKFSLLKLPRMEPSLGSQDSLYSQSKNNIQHTREFVVS